MRSRLTLSAVLVSAAALTLWSCAQNNWLELNPEPDVSAPTFHIMGSVKYLDLEGGVFVITDADGTQYNPVNLPDSFKVDKMAVEAEARRRDDLASAAMAGPMVELLRIRARTDGE
jgi:hypothetical protein